MLCRILGHGADPRHYGSLRAAGLDGINREHASLEMECIRCEETFTVGYMHLPARYAEKELRRENTELKQLLDSVGKNI